MPLPQVIDERFEILELAGQGGMGVVYRALDRRTGELCALKLLLEGGERAFARFEREAAALERLRHPHIVRYLAHGLVDDGRPYLAMEWLEGESLTAALRRGPMAIDDAVEVVRLAAAALGAAHALGIVHRDVKPSNILLRGERVAGTTLIDFGVARVDDARALTLSGHLIGTPLYMAPEQARGAATVDARSDVYALGSVLFHALCGRRPFLAADALSMLIKAALEDAPRVSSLRSVGVALDELVARMLSRDPDARPADGTEVARLLSELAAPGDAAPPSVADPPSLGLAEQRMVSVIACGRASAAPDAALLAGVAERYAATSQALADGTVVALLDASGAAYELCVRAARCALALMRLLPGVPVVLATGLAAVEGGVPLGVAIDRAIAMLPGAPPGRVALDAATAGLLDARFDLRRAGDHTLLVGERTGVAITQSFASPFVGRVAELGELESFLAAAFSGAGPSACVIVGDVGVGKSRLVFELLGRPRASAPRVWIGRGDPLGAVAPFETLATLFRREAGLTGLETGDRQRAALEVRFSKRGLGSGAVARLVAQLCGLPSAIAGEDLLAARSDPKLWWEPLVRAFESFLSLECGHGPLCLLLEDLDACDDASLRLIGLALAGLPSTPFAVMASSRGREAGRVVELWPRCKSLSVGPLTPSEARLLALGLVGEGADPGLLERVVARSGGHPLFVEELVRAARLGRGELPETVLGMMQARLDEIPPALRRVVRLASVLGPSFRVAELAELLAEDTVSSLDPQRAVDELCALGILARVGGDDLAFSQAVLQEAAYAALTDADRSEAHARVARSLERATSVPAAAVAGHYDRAGRAVEAAGWYARAAREAFGSDERAASRMAERGLTLALAAGALGGPLAELRALCARGCLRRGALAEAAELAAAAVTGLTPGNADWFRAVSVVVRAEAQRGRSGASAVWVEQLRAASPRDRSAMIAQLEELCWAAPMELRAGRVVAADELLRTAAVLRERLGTLDALSTARLWYARAVRAMYAGNYGFALESFRAGADCYAHAGYRYRECAGLGNVAMVLALLGRSDEALPILDAALELAAALADGYLMASLLVNRSQAALGAGDRKTARAAAVDALERAQRLDNRALEADARIALAKVLLAAGLSRQARSQAAAAVEAAAPFPSMRARANGLLAWAELALGEPDRALAAAEAGMSVLAAEADGAMEDGEAELRLAYVETLKRTGQRPRAAEALERAQARVRQRAERIADPDLRRTFLDDVPENARTLRARVG